MTSDMNPAAYCLVTVYCIPTSSTTAVLGACNIFTAIQSGAYAQQGGEAPYVLIKGTENRIFLERFL